MSEGIVIEWLLGKLIFSFSKDAKNGLFDSILTITVNVKKKCFYLINHIFININLKRIPE